MKALSDHGGGAELVRISCSEGGEKDVVDGSARLAGRWEVMARALVCLGLTSEAIFGTIMVVFVSRTE